MTEAEMTAEEMIDFLETELPQILAERPELKPFLLDAFIEGVAPREGLADILEKTLIIRDGYLMTQEQRNRWQELQELVRIRRSDSGRGISGFEVIEPEEEALVG